jgi:hypothetical protein
MASVFETTAITRALIALLAAVDELQQAVVEFPPTQNERFIELMKASNESKQECLARIKELVDLMEKNRE